MNFYFTNLFYVCCCFSIGLLVRSLLRRKSKRCVPAASQVSNMFRSIHQMAPLVLVIEQWRRLQTQIELFDASPACPGHRCFDAPKDLESCVDCYNRININLRTLITLIINSKIEEKWYMPMTLNFHPFLGEKLLYSCEAPEPESSEWAKTATGLCVVLTMQCM